MKKKRLVVLGGGESGVGAAPPRSKEDSMSSSRIMVSCKNHTERHWNSMKSILKSRGTRKSGYCRPTRW